ncbi:hypothetical protein LCGC14_0478720 [marine sediment metagenome]|uniref:N-acetyltransferase domain-containing protein n=1 Tax=marine sediment metagenome TaxID=412755 RepID=A0A0F9VIR8_9ZZZZ
MRVYVRLFKPNKCRSVVILSSRRLRKTSQLSGGVTTEADDYFHGAKAMEDDYIIACADLKRTTIDGRRTYYPYGAFVHPDFRNQGFGRILYKACLMCIKHKMDSFNRKRKPLFVQHRIGDPSGSTSAAAKRVYKSLVKQGFLMPVDDGAYKIKKFPKLKYKIIE